MKNNKEKIEKISTEELVGYISEINSEKLAIGANRGARRVFFTIEEARFIVALIFKKSKDLAFFTNIDHISDNYFFGAKFLNSSSWRKIIFFRNFMEGCNATKSAIMAGYSPKCAKQQGYRLLKWIQEHQNSPIGG